MVEPCPKSEWDTSKAYSDRELTKAYEYEIQKGGVPVHEIYCFHHSPLRFPDEFYFEVESKETIKNLARNQKA
jgi:hypothetical protein